VAQAPAPEEAVSTRSLGGGIDVSVVNSAILHWTPKFDIDRNLRGHSIDRDAEGRVLLGHNWLCARTPQTAVLVDPTSWQGADHGELYVPESLPLDDALAALDVAPTDVGHILISHGHFDHVTGLVDERDESKPRFPNADVHVPAADWQQLVVEDRAGSRERLLRYLAPVERAGRLKLVEGDAEICDGVSVLHAEGESPGHQAVRVTGPEDAAYYLGDQIHFTFEFEALDFTPMDGKNLELLEAGRRHVFEDVDRTGGLVVFTHAQFPGWGRIERRSDAGWTWRDA
jgi:glyoxylase-like metal-dependent hydrolase (beta-lactamase superfamily II)